MRLSANHIIEIRIRDDFDFLLSRENDLTPAQNGTVKILRKLNYEKGLKDTEIKQLSDIVKSLKRSAKVLIVRKYY